MSSDDAPHSAAISARQSSATELSGSGPSRRAIEIAVALLLAALGGLVVWDNWRIGAGWDSDGPQAGYFPLRIGALIAFSAVAVLVQALRAHDDETFVQWQQLKSVAIVFIPLVFYIAAIGFLGLYVASILFVAGFMIGVGRYPWWKAALVAIVTMVIFYWVFEIQFKVPLPKGPLERWLGLA